MFLSILIISFIASLPWQANHKIWNIVETRINLAHKATKVISKKKIKTLHGKTSSSREFNTLITRKSRRWPQKSRPPHFVFPGKTKNKTWRVKICGCYNTTITNQRRSFSSIWFLFDKRRDCPTLVYKNVSQEHWTVATLTIDLRRTWVMSSLKANAVLGSNGAVRSNASSGRIPL